jgi:hypothetical protein
MEDFGILLQPAQPLSADLAERELLNCGFRFAGEGSLPRERTYVLCDDTKNIEALLKYDAANEAMASYLSIRYAVCQPKSATEAFLDVVGYIAEKFCLQITGLAPGVEFSCHTLGEFGEYTWEKVKRAKSRWSSLFAGDTEEVVVSVAESWKYFAVKHPEVFRSGPLSVK